MSASPTLSVAQCLVARVDNNSMNLPIKLSSEKQKGIEIVKEGFLDSGASGKFINQKELYQNEVTGNRTKSS